MLIMTKEEKSQYMKEYREKNKEKLLAYMREYSKKYYQKNKEKTREYNKEYREKNKESIKERNRKYHEEHPDANRKSYENFIAKNNWVEYCSNARKRRVEKLKAEGCTNAWSVVVRGTEPKYKKVED